MLQTKDPEKTFSCLFEHISSVRNRNIELYNSKVIIIIERNLGFEAEHLYRYCKNIPNSRFLHETGKTRIGILTTQSFKLAYVNFMGILLRENRITCMPENKFTDNAGNKTRVMLQDQLLFFGFSFSNVENQFSKQRVAIGGKTGGGKDDLAMALLFGIYFAIDQRYSLV